MIFEVCETTDEFVQRYGGGAKPLDVVGHSYFVAGCSTSSRIRAGIESRTASLSFPHLLEDGKTRNAAQSSLLRRLDPELLGRVQHALVARQLDHCFPPCGA